MKKLLAINVVLCMALFGVVGSAETLEIADDSIVSLEKVVGVGLVIEQKSEKAFVIKDIITNSPAGKAGKIQIGDMITAVKSLPNSAWERVYGKTLKEVIAMIRGPLGTPVELKIYHPADHAITDVVMIREEINVPSADALLE